MKPKEKRIAFFLMSFALTTLSFCELSVLAQSQKKYKEPRNTCADLQKIANRIGKKSQTTFRGFENLPVQTDIYSHKGKGTDRLCQLGYITFVSPMGKQICRGNIYTNVESSNLSWDIGLFRSTFYDRENSESEYCRYIN
jgi:hypothetical protein